MAKATVMAVVNQKGGTGKTTTCENLGVGLAMEGKKVLLVDTDPQASLTICLGHPVPDQLSPTLSDMMGKILSEQPIAPGEGILHHPEGVDLIPANIELSGLEVSLVNAMSRETILKQYLDTVKQNYDFILLDCMPSLGMLTVNALAAADNVLIPVQAAYLPAKGLEQLLQTINKVRRQINPKLRIEGILLTMVDSRTNYSKDISNLIRENYGGKLKVYKTDIPRSVRAEEISAEGTSIFKHDPKGKVADAYRILNVTLTNYGLGNVIASSRLTAEQWERYKVLLETLGNRSYLFGEDVSSAPGGGGEYTDYDIPGEALTDTAFANMVREAEKYLGYPYVWGGSSPSTSFDCSGFVSWVINNCGNGWSVGRQTANGLKNLCDIIPPSEAKPGDLIFFQGTYNTSGASHVGIYVGNGMMIHCGDPISYASIETNYWQQHFYCFGRIP